ncbi:VWA domain-containing protein [uncultured Desulfosarcina sp.]|uniref:VWA domain-containing protein n=1 Tax=uncultured Desulfosarcina sp. TaxID=218289 RepID=UPI0029C80BF4|nr:VWA domain-containing protein [uncultured Desulfosarcina sp.]
MMSRGLKAVWNVVFFLLVLATPLFSSHAAQFSAELTIASPQGNFVYDLKVKDDLMRLQKTAGPMRVPSFPTIYNRETGVTRGIMDEMRQYVEETNPIKTMVMNPIVGWEYMRKNMTGTPGGTETVEGYACDVVEYRDAGKEAVAYRVWTSQDLAFAVKTVSYATNGNATMALRNIEEGPQDDALFSIPAGYAKAGPGAKGAKSPARQTQKEKTPPAASGNIVFILDASGSMWGQVEGTAKIAIAKEVLTGLVQELPDDATVGLVAYGHRRKGDCDDVEELIPLGRLDKEKMIAKIQALSPKGKTPISRSVRLTADRLKGLEDETTIILVSDGKETCDPDPCGLVKDLKASGIKFVMHVIGFDVTEEEREQLECMANAGGGNYYTAGNAGEFLAAAREVVEKSTPPYGIFKVSATKNGKPFHTFVTLTDQESGKKWSPGSTSGETGTVELRLAPGMYQAELKDSGVSGGQTPTMQFKDIVIVAGETEERTADFSDGTIFITTLLNGKPFGGNVFYYHQGEKKHFHNENTNPSTGKLNRRLVPGIYRFEVWGSGITGAPKVVMEDVEIPAGGSVEKTVEFLAGELTIVVTLDGKPIATPINIKDAAGKEVFKNWSNWPKNGTRVVKLPEGVYTVKVTSGKQVLEFEAITISAGKSETITAAFPTSQ